jgi:predicted outer membrane repeat protein
VIRRSNAFVCIYLILGLVLVGTIVIAKSNVRAAENSPASTIYVTNTSDSGQGSLREAIIDANGIPGADLISITISGTLQLLSPLPVITDVVSIQGPGASFFTVDGDHSFRVLDIAAEVTLADLTVQHGMVTGTGEYGAGIRSSGNLSLHRVEVLENTAQSHGGGLYVAGNLTLNDASIRNNNSSNGVGGGLRSQGTNIISGTQFIGNTSQGDGGGAYILQELVLTNVLFQENHCTATSCDGGGLFSFSHTDIYNTQFISNTAQDQAGGAAAPGALTITGGLFLNNQAVYGTGGGLYAQNSAAIQDTQFISNTARSFGGGMYAFASADLMGVLFQNNLSAIGTGGGMYSGGNLNLYRSRFIRNAAIEGGGLSHTLGSASLVNSLFAENVAANSSGMAMLLASVGPVDVLHTTIAAQTAIGGSAIQADTGTVAITNTIITNHTIGIDNVGANVHQDFNLFFGNGSNVQGIVTGGGNSLNGDPHFMDPTGDDYHLSRGSAAMDAGVDAGVTDDFDGDARPMALGFDIGFDEANHAPYTIYLPLLIK